jgi:hypothetical protein
MSAHRRFPPPWSIEELDAACFIAGTLNQVFVAKRQKKNNAKVTPVTDCWATRELPFPR